MFSIRQHLPQIRRATCGALFALALLGGCALQTAPAPLANPWSGPWTAHPLPGKRATAYATLWLSDRGHVVQAASQSSASMLRRQVSVTPEELHRLHFSWQVPALIATANLTETVGEDSPVRIVLAFDGDHARLSARNQALFDLAAAVSGERPPYATLMYVWENRAVPDSVIVNPRTDRIRKVVVESGPSRLGRWLDYERDVAADFRRAFGEEPGRLIGIALMTDSDNTQSKASALYGEPFLLTRSGQRL
jgi:hypothetical protein